MRSPLGKAHRITSYFGNRTLGGKPDVHAGIDLVPFDGKHPTQLFAVTSGIVADIRNNVPDSHTGLNVTTMVTGNFVNIKTSDNFTIIYRHLKNGSVQVKKGQKVKEGDLLGIMGNTGCSTGTHLHYQINNPNGSAIDPLPYLATDKPLVTSNPATVPNGTSDNSEVSVGDIVKIKSDAQNYASTPIIAIPAWVKQNRYTVMQVNKSSDKVLLKEIFSWVRSNDIEKEIG